MQRVFPIVSTIVFLAIGCFAVHKQNTKSNPANRKANIVVVAMPKSASCYIRTKIAKQLNYQELLGIHWLNKRYLKNFNIGKPKIIKIHGAPTKENIAKLKEYTDRKLIVHVRDPREAMLSAAHYRTLKRSKRADSLQEVHPFLKFNFEQKIDYLIDSIFEKRVTWISAWLKVKEEEEKLRGGLQIIISSYDSLLADENKFFAKIYEHFAIDSKNVNEVFVTKDVNVNYRKGDPSEWRRVMNSRQIDKMNAMLPDDMLNKFGWKR